jgi:Flp pilus assembly protein TadG
MSQRNRRNRRDHGAAIIEFMSMLPLVLVAIGVAIEMIAFFLTLERVEGAARTGARVAAMSDSSAGRQAAEQALPGWLNDQSVRVGSVGQGAVECTVRAKVPLLWKGIPFDVTVVRRVEMPVS